MEPDRDDTALLRLHLGIVHRELVDELLPGPWWKATPWREGLTGAVFLGGEDFSVALRTVSVPTRSLTVDIDVAMNNNNAPDDIEPSLHWVEVGPAVAGPKRNGSIEWAVGEPMIYVRCRGKQDADILLALRAAVEETGDNIA